MPKIKNLLTNKELQEYKQLVNILVNYCYDDEKKHYDEFDKNKPVDHVFLKIKQLKKLNARL